MSENKVRIRNTVDENGDPGGGTFTGRGLNGSFQDGPLGRGEKRKKPNGCFVEDLLMVAEARMQFYQGTRFACDENAKALNHISDALMCLRSRTERREAQGVEGTNEGN